MTETRDNYLLSASDNYQNILLSAGKTPEQAEMMSEGFYEGAYHADTHPGWHMCSDEMPEFGGDYLCTTGRSIFIDYFDFSAEEFAPHWMGEPIAWMPLPSLP